MPKEFKIETIQDMMEIPLEKFVVFLTELGGALFTARIAHSYNKAMGAEGPTILKPFLWIADGKGEIRTNITWTKKNKEGATSEDCAERG